MKLTREEALKLHRQMWTDMQTALGDNPSLKERCEFKIRWCESHFPNEKIECHCFLCEYVKQTENDCDYCPIKWDDDYDQDTCCFDGVNYGTSPISVILALPEREVEDEVSNN